MERNILVGTIRIVDESGITIVRERFNHKHNLKKRMKDMRVRHWNKLEPDEDGKCEWFLSVIFDNDF